MIGSPRPARRAGTYGKREGAGARALGRLLHLVLALAFAGPAAADDTLAPPAAAAQRPAMPLTVAILDLSTMPDLGPAKAATVRPAWRTSFGSERQTAPEPKPTARDELLATLERVDADDTLRA